MPYKSIKELPERIKKALPKKAQELFMKVFNKAYEKYDEATAFKVAWAAVKKRYTKAKNGKWVLITRVKGTKKRKAKSEFADDLYEVDFVLTTPEPDDQKEVFHKNFLEFISQRLVGLKGDLEHSNVLDLDLPKDWVGKIIDAKPINGEIYASAVLNPKHPYFDVILELAKIGELGASIEIAYDEDDYYIDDSGYRIYVDGEPVGFAFTIDPKKKGAKVYRVRKKRAR